jgi:hypothetical protein
MSGFVSLNMSLCIILILFFLEGLLGSPTSKQLAEILVSVGLAQNFAALRALSTEGIQRGHMSLHSRNIAIAVGAPPHLVSEVSAYMISREQIDIETAHQILKQSPQNQHHRSHSPPSTLFVKLELLGVVIYLNIVFETIGKTPIPLSLRDETKSSNSNIASVQKISSMTRVRSGFKIGEFSFCLQCSL